ncbi:hypothetical protein CFC21_096741 [Triticum aestivum]|uniref:Late embryogenesis abundant protein LEA-2 subgroup domain-containing protein n=2 Tax=Triticum aestivum TaxID=4565 RepID=A0A9R1LT23_WHEAT|nr:hypothetical protein CFC21_096741 [Triticum aestivum]
MHMVATDQSKTATKRFGWLYVARWAAASVVTVLAVAVIIRAAVLMLRPQKLQFRLSGGHVAVDRIPSMPPPDNVVTLTFVFVAYNPSGRALRRVQQQTIVMVGMTPGEDVPMRYVRALFEGRSVEGVELMLSGVFASHVTTTMASGEVTTRYPATYYCWPVTIAVGGSSSSSSPDYTSFVVTDAPCMDESEAPAIV